MPLYPPPVSSLAPPHMVLYGEANSPGVGTLNPIPYDTFKDDTQSTISGAPLTAYLAAMGFTESGGAFTATRSGMVNLGIAFSPNAGPTATMLVAIQTGDYLGGPTSEWGIGATGAPAGAADTLPSKAESQLAWTTYVAVGDVLKVFVHSSDGGLAAINYAAVLLARITFDS